jgi:hypothetical protein
LGFIWAARRSGISGVLGCTFQMYVSPENDVEEVHV